MTGQLYTYRAVVARVEDGDNVIVDIDLGFSIWKRKQSIRLLGSNAIEKAKPGGREALHHLAGLLPVGTVVTLTSAKPDKYRDRCDGKITLSDGSDLVSLLIAEGWAAAWDGVGPRPVPPWPRQAPA